MTVDSLARAEVRRFADEDTSERMRGEMMGILGDLLGISPEQMEELRSEDGQRRLHEGMKKFEGEVRDAIDKMMGGGGGPQGGPEGARRCRIRRLIPDSSRSSRRTKLGMGFAPNPGTSTKHLGPVVLF